jgi:hypothetical protein
MTPQPRQSGAAMGNRASRRAHSFARSLQSFVPCGSIFVTCFLKISLRVSPRDSPKACADVPTTPSKRDVRPRTRSEHGKPRVAHSRTRHHFEVCRGVVLQRMVGCLGQRKASHRATLECFELAGVEQAVGEFIGEFIDSFCCCLHSHCLSVKDFRSRDCPAGKPSGFRGMRSPLDNHPVLVTIVRRNEYRRGQGRAAEWFSVPAGALTIFICRPRRSVTSECRR